MRCVMCGKWLTKASATTKGGAVGQKCAREAGLLGTPHMPLFGRQRAKPSHRPKPAKDAAQMALEL